MYIQTGMQLYIIIFMNIRTCILKEMACIALILHYCYSYQEHSNFCKFLMIIWTLIQRFASCLSPVCFQVVSSFQLLLLIDQTNFLDPLFQLTSESCTHFSGLQLLHFVGVYSYKIYLTMMKHVTFAELFLEPSYGALNIFLSYFLCISLVEVNNTYKNTTVLIMFVHKR